MARVLLARWRQEEAAPHVADLSPRSVRFDLGDGLAVPVAALEDIIRSKEAATREKDRQALPTLRLLLRKSRGV